MFQVCYEYLLKTLKTSKISFEFYVIKFNVMFENIFLKISDEIHFKYFAKLK